LLLQRELSQRNLNNKFKLQIHALNLA